MLPVYNQESFIAETLDSILNQTYDNFNVIVLDDGSTDKTADVIKAYAAKDSRIQAHYHTNAGRANATNKAVNLADGELCALIDADDIMMPERLAKQVAFHLQNKEVEATSCDCYYINEFGQQRGTQIYPGLRSVEESRQAANRGLPMVAITGIMIYKDAYLAAGGLDNRFWPCDDIEFTARFLDMGYNLVIISEFLMKYRVHSKSASMQKLNHVMDIKEYVSSSVGLRRSGKPVVSFEDFKKAQDQRPLLQKLKTKAHYYAMVYYKNAGISYHSKNYVKFAFELLVVGVLEFKYLKAALNKSVRNKKALS